MNIAEVAKRAKVSTATVSRVINGTATVNEDTAERVRAAIEALNFYPNTNARALGSGRSDLYGLIISDITNPYFPELAKAFEDIAVEHAMEVLTASTNYDPKRMETCIVRMLQRKVDGVAIMTSEMDERLVEFFTSRNIPMIFMDTATNDPDVSVIRVNYSAGVCQAMQHLFDLGHKRIAFISGPLSLSSAQERLQAYQSCMRDRDFSDRKLLFEEGDHRVEGGQLAMERLLARKESITAVLASNDLTAIGAMGAIHARGLRIPDDISVVGFDGITLSAYTHPALTTLHVSRREMADIAFRSLYQQGKLGIKSPMKHEHTIQPQLVVRGSTAVAKKKRNASGK